MLIQIDQHRRMQGNGLQHLPKTAADMRADRVFDEGRGQIDVRGAGLGDDSKMIGKKGDQPFAQGLGRVDGAGEGGAKAQHRKANDLVQRGVMGGGVIDPVVGLSLQNLQLGHLGREDFKAGQAPGLSGQIGAG